MGDCCHGPSTGSNGKKSRLGWWLLGGFALVAAVSWTFQDNPLVDQLAPLALGGLALAWLVTLTMHKMGVGR